LLGCGGGGEELANPRIDLPDSSVDSQPLTIIETIPRSDVINADPDRTTLAIAHLSRNNPTSDFSTNCSNIKSIKISRRITDPGPENFSEITQHIIDCDLEENTEHTITLTDQGPDGENLEGDHKFSTGVSTENEIIVKESIALSRDQVRNLFASYVSGALLSDLEAPAAVIDLILEPFLGIADQYWKTLLDPRPLYDVISERVSYQSQDPFGNPITDLTGLVSYPDIQGVSEFSKRSTMILLSHATGSSPGDLNPEDAWFIIANQLSSRGYLVLAPDNYGRGKDNNNEETYLLAAQTAFNGLDLVLSINNNKSYDPIYEGKKITLIGYSQGGHSATNLLSLSDIKLHEHKVVESFLGGAPFNLYKTFKGVLEFLNGSCSNREYCEFVDSRTSVPFATNRILPALVNYSETGLDINDLVIENTLSDDFVNGFLASDPLYEKLKLLLELNSLTNVKNPESFFPKDTLINLYHSPFDRLVPIANSQDFMSNFSSEFEINFDQSECNANAFEVIFETIDKAGIVHTLCALNVLDAVISQLR